MLLKKKQLIRAEMRARLKRPEKQAMYRKRKWVAEQVFGQIKEGLGFRGMTVRGKKFARAQWLFTCAVHNVMKAARYLSGGRKDADRQGAVVLGLAENRENHPLRDQRLAFYQAAALRGHPDTHLAEQS